MATTVLCFSGMLASVADCSPALVMPLLMACARLAVLPYALAYMTATLHVAEDFICASTHSLQPKQHPCLLHPLDDVHRIRWSS